MKAIGIIPARYEAQRFPGKVLADLLGKPLIQYVYEEALKSTLIQDLIVATDDERIKKTVEGFGGRAVFTSRGHASGTDRITEIVNPIDSEIVINIQSDEPLIHYSMIDDLVRTLSDDNSIPMATLAYRIKERQDLYNPNIVKVVKDINSYALYFSRSPIPHVRDSQTDFASIEFFKHIGIYGYTKEFLFTFKNLPLGELEKAEKLEQLRVLEKGYKIKIIETGFDTIGVDTPEDLEKVKERLKEK